MSTRTTSGHTIHGLALLDIEAFIAIDPVLVPFLGVGDLADLVVVVDEVPV